MEGYFTHTPDIPRLSTSSSSLLHGSLPSPGPNSTSSSLNGSAPTGRFEQASLSTFFITEGTMGTARTVRGRRRSTPGLEPVKHRRTRSGCFTCRNRRVKCDEKRPVCDRCHRGGRDCTYPDAKPSTSRKKERAQISDGSNSLDELEEVDEDQLQASQELQVTPELQAAQQMPVSNQPLGIPGQVSADQNSVPTTPAEAIHEPEYPPLPIQAKNFKLSQGCIYYLHYHRLAVTHHHYLLKTDFSEFFKIRLMEHAFESEALAYAIAAFSCFHFNMNNYIAEYTFLEYYDKAVSLLRRALRQKITLATLLTILQLASFEEYMGDWGNLMHHRNAAADIIQSLFSPKEMIETAERRIVYDWYIRFDIFAALMAGHPTALPREWSDLNRDFYAHEVAKNPDNIFKQIEYGIALLRDIAIQMSCLTLRRTQGTLSVEDFDKEGQKLKEMQKEWWNNLDPALLADRPKDPEPFEGPTDLDPFVPAEIYTDIRWGVNYMLLDYYGLSMMMEHQFINEDEPRGICTDCLKCCRIIAGIIRQDVPRSWLLPAQAVLGLAALWLPPEHEYRHWIRRQLARVEVQGYIYPRAFRARISELWGDPMIQQTWCLPDESAHVGMAIRELGDSREVEFPAVATDPLKEEIKGMRALLSSMKIDGSTTVSTPDSSSSPSRHTGDSPREVQIMAPQQFQPQSLQPSHPPLVDIPMVPQAPFYPHNHY